MSTNEIAVVIFGLFLGYWVVSKLFLGGDTSSNKDQQKEDPKSESTAAHENPAWHQVLNVNPDATASEIRSAYKTLISQYHPDKVASLGAELRTVAEQKTKEITVAYRQAMKMHGFTE